MTDQEMRIAIAETCGYERTDTWISGWMRRTPEHPTGFPCSLPDYLNDLNAIHEAEATLTEYQRIVYLENLTPKHTPIKDRDWTAFHATARQRSEAFLRTIGKWRNG